MKHLEKAIDGQNQIWKYILVLFIAFIVAGIIGSFPFVFVIFFKTMRMGLAFDSINIYNLSALGISSNVTLILMMLPLVLGLFSMILFLPSFHKRTYKEVINGTKHIRWERFFTAAGIWTILMLILSTVDYVLNPDNFVFQFELSSFIPLFIISILIIPLQTTFEELAFRGYLAQGIAAHTRSRLLVLIIPSVIFGLMHSFNPEVQAHGFMMMMPQYIFMGMMLGLMAILDDGIETAMGVHAANNVFLALFITNSSSVLQTASVFEQLKVDPSEGFIGLVISYSVLMYILKMKYNWDFSVLNKKVEEKQISEIESDK